MTTRIPGDTFTDHYRELFSGAVQKGLAVSLQAGPFAVAAARLLASHAALRAEVERLTKDAESIKRLAAPDDGQTINRHGWRGRAAVLRQERDEARAEVERATEMAGVSAMQLAACGVAALHGSRDVHLDYRSSSLTAVIDLYDECVRLRDEAGRPARGGLLTELILVQRMERERDEARTALAAMTAERDEARTALEAVRKHCAEKEDRWNHELADGRLLVRETHEREVREVAIECLALWGGAVDIEVFGRSVCSRDTDAGNVVDHVLAERAKQVPTPEPAEARAPAAGPSSAGGDDERARASREADARKRAALDPGQCGAAFHDADGRTVHLCTYDYPHDGSHSWPCDRTRLHPTIVPDNDGRALFTEPVVGAKYRHYKGGLYRLEKIAARESDGLRLAVYDAVGEGASTGPWVRPLAEFARKFRREEPAPTIVPDQPSPTGQGEEVWPRLIAAHERSRTVGVYDLFGGSCDGTDAYDLAAHIAESLGIDLGEAMKERDRIGRERYGTPLRTHNGRWPRVGALQEALDLVAYLAQARMEERKGGG